MKRKLVCIHGVALVSILISFLGTCLPVGRASAKESHELDQWVAKYVNKGEKLLCQREENGEYFFMAQAAGDKMKVGSRLDVTRAPGDNWPKAFIVAWMFQNENNDYVVTHVPPTTVKAGYEKDSGKTYADEIEYQTLYLKGSRKLRVTIDIKKCPTAACDRQQTKSPDEKKYTVRLCEVPLNKK